MHAEGVVKGLAADVHRIDRLESGELELDALLVAHEVEELKEVLEDEGLAGARRAVQQPD